MRDTPIYYVRQFLNKPQHGNAFIEATVDAFDTKWGGGDAELIIKDCSRQVALSFDVGSDESRENSRQKIAFLRDVIAGFEAGLLKLAEQAEAFDAAEKAKKLADPNYRRGRRYEVEAEPELTIHPGAAPAAQQLSNGDECDCGFCYLNEEMHGPTASEGDATGVPCE